MGVSSSVITRVTGVEVIGANFNVGSVAMLPQRLTVIGVGNKDKVYDGSKFEVTNATAVAERFGYGSPLHLACRQLFPATGTSAGFPVTINPVLVTEDSVQATGDVTISGTATEAGVVDVFIGGFTVSAAIAKDDTAAIAMTKIVDAINAEINMPCTALVSENKIVLTAKYGGTVGNDIVLIVSVGVAGLSSVQTAFTGGALDGDIEDALLAIGEVWETAILSCYPYNDQDRLDQYMLYGKDRWGVLNKKPLLVFHGCTDGYTERSAVTDVRKEDYINALITSVGSPELPYVVAAKAMVFDILTTANSNPPLGYKGKLEGLKAGDDSAQEDVNTRNLSVTKGASTNIKVGSVCELNDIITMYHPDSEGKYPLRRYVVDAMKLMNVVYNVRLIMESDSMKAAVLIGDNDDTINPAAIQPKAVKAQLLVMAKNLVREAIIQDYEFTKANLTVSIDSENSKRINATVPVKLSGNVEVSSTEIYFGFYLGGN